MAWEGLYVLTLCVQDGTVIVHTVKHGLYLRTLRPPREKGRRVSIEKLAVSSTGQICVYCQHRLKANASDDLVSLCDC